MAEVNLQTVCAALKKGGMLAEGTTPGKAKKYLEEFFSNGTKAAKSPSKKQPEKPSGCAHIISSGARKNQPCGAPISKSSTTGTFCSSHYKKNEEKAAEEEPPRSQSKGQKKATPSPSPAKGKITKLPPKKKQPVIPESDSSEEVVSGGEFDSDESDD